MMTELKKRRKINIRSYFVATDYTCSPGVNQTAMDAYFIPHKKLIKEFADNGLPMSRIIPSGIPVRCDFYNKTEPQKAKRTLSLPQDKRVALLMCGSMGCGPIKDLAELLPQQLPEDALLVIICGNNVKLYRSLTKYPLPENVRVIGFTSRMPLYMDAAELILTKPGGLSTTEAAVKGLPMIFIDAVPGCETRNIEFFISNGCADMREGAIKLCDAVCDYLEIPSKLHKMSQTLKDEFSGCAAEIIREHIVKDADCVYGRL